MKSRELIREVEQAGGARVPGRGDHATFKFPDGHKVSIPHGGTQNEASPGAIANVRRAIREHGVQAQEKTMTAVSEAPSTFAGTLKRLREEAGLSRQDLAVKIDAKRDEVDRWEGGLAFPESAPLARLLEAIPRLREYAQAPLPPAPPPGAEMPPQKKTLAQAIREARKAAGLSISHLAAKVGVSDFSIRSWEGRAVGGRKANRPSAAVYDRLLEALPDLAAFPRPDDLDTRAQRTRATLYAVVAPSVSEPPQAVTTSIEALGVAYARALADVTAAEKLVVEAKAKAQAALEALQREAGK